jgi:hypothetical protein
MEIKVYATRSSTGMEDDAASKEVRELAYDSGVHLSSLMNDLRKYVPMLQNVVWSVWCKDQIVGYLYSYGYGGYQYYLPGDVDSLIHELPGSIIHCQYYGEDSFRISAYEKQHDVTFPESPYVERVAAYEEQMIRDKGAEGFLRPDFYSKDEERIISEARKGKTISDEKYEAAVAEEPAKEYPMKWHKFMMVIMVIGAIGNCVIGIWLIIQSIVHDKILRYAYGIQAIMIEYGILLIVFGVFWFIVRNRLKTYKKNAPIQLMSMYFIGFVMSVFFTIASASIVRLEIDYWKLAIYVIGTGVIIYLHKVYYGKRKRMFDK